MDYKAFIKIFEFARDNNITVQIKYHDHDASYLLVFTDSDYHSRATYISATLLDQVLDENAYLGYIINELLKELNNIKGEE